MRRRKARYCAAGEEARHDYTPVARGCWLNRGCKTEGEVCRVATVGRIWCEVSRGRRQGHRRQAASKLELGAEQPMMNEILRKKRMLRGSNVELVAEENVRGWLCVDTQMVSQQRYKGARVLAIPHHDAHTHTTVCTQDPCTRRIVYNIS
jgi:hypothetical protein